MSKLNRRAFVRAGGGALAAGGGLGLAGCIGSSESDNGTGGGSSGGGGGGGSGGGEELAPDDQSMEFTESGVGVVSMEFGELDDASGEAAPIPVLRGVAENVSAETLSFAEIVVTFSTESAGGGIGEDDGGVADDLGTTATDRTTDIAAGERWTWAGVYSGSRPELIQTATVDRIDARAEPA